ncbi:helix-turn-helix domain-containing protein [Pseudonocardia acaciae]|uniref:helix-turn-helix domain-containing protein n=1 Tax=Pseudonocardia acaciae TaxID=551276 RepID=UPI001B80DDB1|nr:helix-turn-helix domain-containing protein [Pseudonocardia acaciae]
MAAIRTADGRVVAAVADQQGYPATPTATPASQVAVQAAMKAAADALAANPNLPGERLARTAFDAAAEATEQVNQITTFLLVVITPTGPDSSQATFIWVGDSRGYTVDATSTEQVTEDHTWGVINTAETAPDNQPRQQITHWVGDGPASTPGTETREVTGPVRIVLTTDELHDFYPNAAGLGAIVTAAATPADAADGVIDNVRTQGSGNKTIIVIDANSGPQAALPGPAAAVTPAPPAPATPAPSSAPTGQLVSRAHRDAVVNQLRDAIAQANADYLAGGAAADRRAVLVDAVRRAAHRGLPVAAIARITWLDRAEVEAIVAGGQGGPVADGVPGDIARAELEPLMPAVVAGARPLTADEFPNLIRGPPGLTSLIRITDEDLLDGKLIAFAWKGADGNPVIVIPARVARLIDRLIALDPAFADWWNRLLRHEHDFHLGEHPEHDGEHHDNHAAALVAELRAAAASVGLLAVDENEHLVSPGDPAMAEVLVAVVDTVEALERRGEFTGASVDQVRAASPEGRWVTDGLVLSLGEGFAAELARTLAARGLPAVTVVYYLDRSRRRIIADRTLFTDRVGPLPQRDRIALEGQVQRRWRQAGTDAGAPAGLELHPLAGASYQGTLLDERYRGRPKVLLLRGADGRTLVAKHWERDPSTLLGAVLTARLYRLLGVSSVSNWLAIATEDITIPGTDDVVVFAGDLLEVTADYLPGQPATLDAADSGWQRRQVAAEFAITAFLRDWDGVLADRNLMVHGGRLWRIDFDKALRRGHDAGPVARVFSVGEHKAVLGLLTEDEVLTQFARLVAMREHILAEAPNEDFRQMLAARLDWLRQVVDAWELPDEPKANLARARRTSARDHPGDRRPDDDPPLVTEPPAGGPARPAAVPDGRAWLVTGGQLLILIEAGAPVRVHDHRGHDVWEVTLRQGDERLVNAQPWTPDARDFDRQEVRAALLRVLGRNARTSFEQYRDQPTAPRAPPGGSSVADPTRLDELLDAAEEHLEMAGLALARRDPALAEILTRVAQALAQALTLLDQLPPADRDPRHERLTELAQGWATLAAVADPPVTGPAAQAVRHWLTPPGGGLTTRRFGVREHRKVVAGFRPLLSRLSDAEHGPGFLLVDWPAVRPLFEREGLPDLGREMIAYTVFDEHGRAWTIQFTHVHDAIAALPAPLRAFLEDEILAHERRHAAKPSATHPEDGWREHDRERRRIVGLVLDALAGRPVRLPEHRAGGRADRGDTPRAVLDTLAADGRTAAEVAAALGAGEAATGRRLATLAAWGLVHRGPDTRPGGRSSTWLYTLPEHTRALLALLDDPTTVRDPRAQRVLRALADWFSSPAALDRDGQRTTRIATTLDAARALPGSPLPPPASHVAPNSLRATLDAVTAEGSTITEVAAATGLGPGPTSRRLATLTNWDLLRREPNTRPGASANEWLYVLPDHTRALLTLLDNPDRHPSDFGRRALRTLAEHLRDSASLKPDAATTAKIAAALDAVRAIPNGPLPPPTGHVPTNSLRATLEAATPEGRTAAEIAEATGLGVDVVGARLTALTHLGLLERTPNTRPGANPREWLHHLPEHTRTLLDLLDNPANHPAPARRALSTLADLLRAPATLRPGTAHAAKLASALDTVRAIPNGPLPAPAAPPAVSPRAMLDTVRAAEHGITAGELAHRTGIEPRLARRWLTTLTRLGLLDRAPDTRPGGNPKRWLYTVPDRTTLLLTLADNPAGQGFRAKRALRSVHVLLARPVGTELDADTVTALDTALSAVRALPGGPLPAAGEPASPHTVRTVLDAIGDQGVTAVELAGALRVGAHVARRRLALLAEWGLLERAPNTRPGANRREWRFHLPEHTRALLADLDDTGRATDPAYRAALDRLAPLLAQPTGLTPGSATAERIRAALDALRVLPAGALAVAVVPVPAGSLRATLDAVAAADGLTVTELAEAQGLHRITARLRLAAFLEWGLVVRDRGDGSRDYVHRLAEGAAELLALLDRPETHHGGRAPLAALVTALNRTERLDPASPATAEVAGAVAAVRDMPGGPLPTQALHVQANSVLATLTALAAAPDGLTVAELAAALPGVDERTVQRRLPTLVGWGLVWQARDTRPGGNPRELVYRLPAETAALLDALPTGPAPRELAAALNKPSMLAPGEATTVAIEIAIDAVRALPGGPLSTRGPPPAPNSVRGTLHALAGAGRDGLAAAELAQLAGIAKSSILKRLRALVEFGLVAQVPDRRDGAGPRAVAFVLTERTPALLDALATAPLHPRTDEQRALRTLADLLNKPVDLVPGTQAQRQAAAAVAAIDWFAAAFDPRTGRPVELTGPVLDHVRAVLVELVDEGLLTTADADQLAIASPGELWADAGMTLLLARELNRRLVDRLEADGLDPVVVVFLVNPGSRQVIADAGLFDRHIAGLSEQTLRFLERHEAEHVTGHDPDEAAVWAAHPPAEPVARELAALAERAHDEVEMALALRPMLDRAARSTELAGRWSELGWHELALADLHAAAKDLATVARWAAAQGADETLSDLLVTTRGELAELTAALRTRPVLVRLGLRMWQALDANDGALPLDELAGLVGAPHELVTEAAKTHPGLRARRASGGTEVAIRPGWRIRAVPLPADFAAETPGLTLPSDGELTRRAEWWLVAEHRPLTDFERSLWLAELLARAWRASPGPAEATDRLRIHRARVDVPAGLVLLDHDGHPTDHLELVVDPETRRLLNAYPAGPTAPRLPDPPAGSVPTVEHRGAVIGTGWMIAPDRVATTLGPHLAELGPGDLARLSVAGFRVASAFRPGEDTYRDPVAFARASQFFAMLHGQPVDRIDLVVLHVPGLAAAVLPTATEDTTTEDTAPGQRLLIAGRTAAPVLAAGPAVITLLAPPDPPAPGSPLLAPDGRVAGMVTHVDADAGLVFALPAALLAPAAPAAIAADPATPERLLRHATRLLHAALDQLDAARPPPARDLLRNAEAVLDAAAAALAADRDGELTDEDYHRVFDQLRTLAKNWWTLLTEADGTPTNTAAHQRATAQAHALNTMSDPDELLDAAPALGRPEQWRIHPHHDYDPARFLDAYRALTEPQPAPATTAEAEAANVQAYFALETLTAQLPADQAAPLATALAHWARPSTPPPGLLDYLEQELPTTVAPLTLPALAVARHHLRQASVNGT